MKEAIERVIEEFENNHAASSLQCSKAYLDEKEAQAREMLGRTVAHGECIRKLKEVLANAR